MFAGPADKGVYSLSLQQTAYNMATEVCLMKRDGGGCGCGSAAFNLLIDGGHVAQVLRRFPEVTEVFLATPNVHFFPFPLEVKKTKNKKKKINKTIKCWSFS